MTAKPDDEGARVQTLLVKALNANVSVVDLPAERREETAMEFLDFLGRLVEVVEGQHPTPARAAALIYLTESMGLDRMPESKARIVITLVEGMKRIGQFVRDEAAKKAAV